MRKNSLKKYLRENYANFAGKNMVISWKPYIQVESFISECCRLGMVEVKLLGAKIKDGGNKSFSEVFTPTGEQF